MTPSPQKLSTSLGIAVLLALSSCHGNEAPTPSIAQRAQLLMQEAEERVRLGDADSAAELFCSASELAPFEESSIYRWADLALQRKDLGSAILAASQAYELQPSSARARELLGDCHALMQNWRTAAQWWEKSLELHPDNPKLRSRLGDLLADRLNRPKESVWHTQLALDALPESAQAWGSFGMALCAYTAWKEAEEALRKAIELDPNLVQAHLNLSHLYSLQGRDEEALSQAQFAAMVEPPEDRGFRDLAIAQVQLGRWDEALLTTRLGLKLNVRENVFWALRCFSYLAKGEARKAAEIFERASQKDERFFCHSKEAISDGHAQRAVASLAKSLRQRFEREPKDAELALGAGLLELLMQEGEAAASWFSRAAALLPKDPLPRRLRAIACWSQSNFQEAKRFLMEAELFRKDDANTQALFGIFLEAQGEHDSAISSFRRAVALDSSLAFTKFHLGDVLYHQKDALDESEKWFSECRASEPGYMFASEHLGRVASDRDRYGEALLWYREALTIRPHDEQSLNGFGLTLERAKNFEQAVHVFSALIESDSVDSEKLARWRANRAHVLWNMYRHEAALADYAEAVKLDSRKAWIREQYVELLIQMGRTSRANEEAKTLARQNPDSLPVIQMRADELMQAGRYQEALPLAESLVAKSPDRSEYRVILGRCFFWLGRRAEAVSVFQKAIALDSNNHVAVSDLVSTLDAMGRAAEIEALEQAFFSQAKDRQEAIRRLAKHYRDHGGAKYATRLEKR